MPPINTRPKPVPAPVVNVPAPEVTVHTKDERIQNFYSRDPWVRGLLALIALLLLLVWGAEHGWAQSAAVNPVGLYWWNGSKFVAVNSSNPLPVTTTSGTNPCAFATGTATPSTTCWVGLLIAGALQGWTGVNPNGSVYAAQIDLTSMNGVSLGSPSNYGSAPGAVEVQGVNAFVTNTVPVNQSQIGGSAIYVDPCLVNTPIPLPFNEATGSTTTIIAGVASKQTYICSIFLFVGGAATNINLLEGTGTNCSSVSAGLMGGSTAATGPNFAANQGFVMTNGGHWVMKTATLADNVCYAASASTQVSGVINYVQQ